MRDSWTSATLGETCNMYQPTTISAKNFVSDGAYLVYGSNGIIGRFDKYNHENSELIVACRGTCGKMAITLPFSWINGNAMVVHPKTDNLDIHFLKYQLEYSGLSNAVTGSSIPQITRQSLAPVRIAFPSNAEQQKIVDELDLLVGIKTNYTKQLEELNNLSQSIFFSTFGNPVANDKKWPVKPLKDLATFKNGLNFDKADKGRPIKILGVSDFQDRKIVDNTELSYILLSDSFNSDYLLKDGDFVFVRSNGSKSLIGRCVLVHTGGEDIVYSGFCIRCRFYDNTVQSDYFSEFVRTQLIKDELTRGGQGCNIQNLNQGTLGNLIIPIPPKSIQDSFSKEMQEIERQKAYIVSNLTNIQCLIDATLDKYFG